MQASQILQVRTRSESISSAQSAFGAHRHITTADSSSFHALLNAISIPTQPEPAEDHHVSNQAVAGALSADLGMFDDAGRADRARQLRDNRANASGSTGNSTNENTLARLQSEPVHRAAFESSPSKHAQRNGTSNNERAIDTANGSPSAVPHRDITTGDVSSQSSQPVHTASLSANTETSQSQVASNAGMSQQQSDSKSTMLSQSAGSSSVASVGGVRSMAGTTGGSSSSGQQSQSQLGLLGNRALFKLESVGVAKQGMSVSHEQAERMTAQIKGALGQILKGSGGTVSIKLTPENLGTVRVQLQIHNGSAKATIEATTQHAFEALNQSIGDLRSSLEDRNVRVESIEVRLAILADKQTTFDPANQHQSRNDDATTQDHQQGDSGQPKNKHRLRSEHAIDRSEIQSDGAGPLFAYTEGQHATAHVVHESGGSTRLALDAIA